MPGTPLTESCVIARSLALLSLALLVTACAGFRGGWESAAYIGEAPPAGLAERLAKTVPRRPPELEVGGLKLRVSIDNRVRTYDTQVYLFALPLSIDPRRAYSGVQPPGTTRVFVHVTPQVAGYVFIAEAAALRFAGQQFRAIGGHEFGRWDESGQRAERGGRWDHRPTTTPYRLDQPGRRYLLSIDFAAPVPSPEAHDIELDLSMALQAPGVEPIPLIRFTPVEWEEGYT